MTVVKTANLVANSTKNWEDAVSQAVVEASKTMNNITGVELLNKTASIKDGKIVEYKANINVAYTE